jgi:hypothetical protein
MGRQRIEEIETSFEQIFKFIMSKPDRTLSGLVTTGNVPFSCQAKKQEIIELLLHCHTTTVFMKTIGAITSMAWEKTVKELASTVSQ